MKSNKSRTVVVVENVTFCFPDSSLPLMQNMSARFPAGLNAIIGPSGVGKSTVVNIILGFIRPNSGSVYFLSESGSRIASPKISLVPQSPHIFFGGVVQNISLGLPLSPGDTEYIYNLLLECNLDSLHLDTLLSLPYEIQYENLLNLSGGEKQRLCIARALFHKSSLLVIDEGTNSLDIVLEYETVQLLKKLSRSVTIILVSHSKQVMQLCDKLFLFDDSGSIVTSGSYVELLRSNPNFGDFVREGN